MAEDLRNYKLQLQQVTHTIGAPRKNNDPSNIVQLFCIIFFQVEAALLTDPENDELLKLKSDLEEVIELTRDLIKTQEGEAKATNIHGSSNDDDVTASLLAAEEDSQYESQRVYSKWQVGEKCLAKWRTDGA